MLKKEELKEYIYGKTSSDRTRLMLQYELNKSSFLAAIERVLEEYGLAERLKRVQMQSWTFPPMEKVQILDIGCGEGMHLYELARVLERRGLLKAAELNGIDYDQAAILVAEQYSLVSVPPRPYLNFHACDATRPLKDCQNLAKNGQALQFDFIYAFLVLEHLPDAKTHLQEFYRALKPGGVIYLRGYVTEEGEEGWLPIHPALRLFGLAYDNYMQKLNPGPPVACMQAGWLREFGAEMVQSFTDKRIDDLTTERGSKMLQNILMMAHNSAPHLIAQGSLSQAEFEEKLHMLYREIRPDSLGQLTYIDTFARKPAL